MSIEEVQRYFASLNLKDWTQQGYLKKGGQALALKVKNNKTSTLGVFRLLKNPEETDIKRFKRELNILIKPEYQNQYIVEILEYSKSENEYWYISKRGDPFGDWWQKKKTLFETSPDRIVDLATEVICSLCDGLAPLHESSVVHRDIKPDNIIILNDVPILIDFGLVFDPKEERLTPLDSATGNARFSPDQMMSRLENIPAWLDVFQLSQLLIWMTMVKPTKNWSRPLDWKWVIYPSDFSIEKVSLLRAITAMCSNFICSPKSALEL